MTRFWDGQTDGQTDGVTALLDLLSPSATQVKIYGIFQISLVKLLINCGDSLIMIYKKSRPIKKLF